MINWIRKGLCAIGLAILTLNINAQGRANDTIKVTYPGDSTTIQVLNEQEEEDVLTPDDELMKAFALKDNPKKTTNKARDWAKWRPNAKKSLWLALVLPGAGQIYNRKYWKLPIFYGGFVGCIYAMTWNNQMYHDYAQAYIDITDNDPTTQSYNSFLHLGTTITNENMQRYQNIFRQRKDRYRRWRDLSIFTTIGVYLLSVIDAYVDASLSDFDISDDLSLHVSPTVISDKSWATPNNPFKSSAIGIGCSLTF